MLNKKNITIMSTVLLFMGVLVVPQLSYADWGYRYHDHPRYGYRSHYLPRGYFTLWVGRSRYYYYDGLYYNYIGGNYVLIAPPVGAVVANIPSDFQPLVINGVTYYLNNGTYYVYTRHGYQVVAQPVTVVAQAPTPVVVSSPAIVQDSFTVNVPNNSGGYISVVIKRSGNGYVGPQGEFYAQFPKVAQLKVMYGK